MSTDDTTIHRLLPAERGGPLSDEEILRGYAPPDRPWLRANFIASADGAASAGGLSGGLNSPSDKRVFDLLRVGCDAVMVGAGTLRAEGYGPMVMTARQREAREAAGRADHPVLVAVSGRLDLDPDHPMFTDAPVRPYVLTHAGAPAGARRALERVATVLVAGSDGIDIRAGRDALADAGLRHVLCEGGPHLLGTVAGAGLLDELCLTVAPMLAGPGPGRIVAGTPFDLIRYRLAQVLRSERDELFLRYLTP